jgi:hypothetical protein
MIVLLRPSSSPPSAAPEPLPNRPWEGPPERRARRWARHAALALVFLAAFGLRVAYGWPDPSASRSWDDRFGLPNVESILRTRSFAPVNAYHPSLSYLPQTLVLGAVDACRCLELGTRTRRALGPRRRADLSANVRGVPAISAVTPLGYRACRLWQSLLGAVAGLLLALLVGRLVSPAWGVAAAAVLAFVPWHVWISSMCNEDTALFLGIELAALGTLFAVRRRDALGFATAGLTVGIALASKLNAGPAALPLTVWALATARRDRRQLARLALAGAVALAFFLVLNPHYVTEFQKVRHDFGVTVDIYQHKAAGEETGFLGVLASGLLSPAAPGYLGIPLALLVLIGLARAARPSLAGDDARRATGLRLMAVFPLTYLPVYALVTHHVADRNWLPVLPFALVLAAAGGATLVAAARRSGRAWLVPVTVVALLAAAAPVAVRGVRFVYRAVVPPTTQLAARVLRHHLHGHAVVLRDVPPDRDWTGREVSRKSWLEVYVEPDDAKLDLARLERSRGWILSAPTAASVLAHSPAGTDAAALGRRIPPRLFFARGPELVVGWRGWRTVARGTAGLSGETWGPVAEARVTLPEPRQPERSFLVVRFGLVFAGRSGAARGCSATTDAGEQLPVHLQRRRRLHYRQKLEAGAPWSRAAAIRFTERFPATLTKTLTLRCEADQPIRFADPVEVLVSVATGAGSRASAPADDERDLSER